MKKVAIVGFKGKMGSLISKALENEYLVIGIGKEEKLDNFESIDLVVDFASHESSVGSAEFCLKQNIPLIIGSTGQTLEENQRIDEISRKIKVVKKANFSRGIDVLKMFIDNVLKLNPDRFEIIEKHHINKKDKPSGTALELKHFIEKEKRFSGEISITSIREGEEMGEHIIVAYIGDEKISIKHNVYSRDAFVRGVVKDVENLLKSK